MRRPSAPAAIRPATDGDARAVAELRTEAYVTSGTGGRTEPYSELDFHASAERGRVFVAARKEGEIVGAVALIAPGAPGGELHRASGEAELSRLAVAPTARREGIGRMLADFCTERAREAGWSEPYPLLNDSGFRLADELGLPTFEAHGVRYYRRLTFIARRGRMAKVFYPVFPPQSNANDVVAWLRSCRR